MKKFSLMIMLGTMFVGCGGGSGDGGSPSTNSDKKYDIWDYIAPKQNKTYMLDTYQSNSSYTTYTNKISDAGYIEYSMISSNRKIVDFNGEVTATFEVNNNSINVAGTSIKRFASYGSKIGECVLAKHYNTFTVAKKYTFTDVLQFDCDNYKEFYVKNKGNIINYTSTTYINGKSEVVRYGISVANNAYN